MNKHAYLIVAHTNWAQLKLLLGQLDHDTNDIYLHINIKSIDFNAADTKNSVKNAGLFLLDRREVRWGFYSLTEIALDFLETATNRNYNYYHFLTGSDLLIKSNKFVVDFFETHGGHEFVERVYPLSFNW